jgi:transcriptional regulator GlxA family with amidase domain
VRAHLGDPRLSRSSIAAAHHMSPRNRSVAALAARWCFFDAAHFSHVFRQHYGYPPSLTRP